MTFKKFVIFGIGAVLAAISLLSFSGSAASATALLQNEDRQNKASSENKGSIDQAALEDFIQTLYFGVDKDGSAPAANINVTSDSAGKTRAKKA